MHSREGRERTAAFGRKQARERRKRAEGRFPSAEPASRLYDHLSPFDDQRWGVWAVSFPYPMTSRENARKNLAAVLPDLKQRWEEWKGAGFR